MDINITLITNALYYYDQNNEKYRDSFKKVVYTKFIIKTNDMEHNIIIMYNDKKEELFRSRFETIGLYNSDGNSWAWAWTLPLIRKNNTHIIRKIMNYGVELDPEVKFLKTELITSRFRIADPIQLDIHVAIASYLSKKPLIYNHYVNIDFDRNTDEYLDVTQTFDHYQLYYLFLLDYEQFN
jgi:hypothetical protein